MDLTIQPGKEKLAKESNRYYGRSILTPYAKLQLINQIGNFLEKQLLEDYYSSKGVELEKRTNDYFAENIDTIIDWYKSLERDKKDKKDAFLEQILPVYKYLKDSGFHLLAQSLSGFNEALLMQKQTFQLRIHDPLGFADYQPFTEAVYAAVKGATVRRRNPTMTSILSAQASSNLINCVWWIPLVRCRHLICKITR